MSICLRVWVIARRFVGKHFFNWRCVDVLFLNVVYVLGPLM